MVQDHNGKVTIAELIEALSAEKKLTHQELSAFRVRGQAAASWWPASCGLMVCRLTRFL